MVLFPEEQSFSEAFAHHVYDVLVQICGAPEADRDRFVLWQSAACPPREWRFGGKLGFGGKFWRNNGKIYVACYREDNSKRRRALIEEANRKLAELFEARHSTFLT